jgi:hypothetical protein
VIVALKVPSLHGVEVIENVKTSILHKIWETFSMIIQADASRNVPQNYQINYQQQQLQQPEKLFEFVDRIDTLQSTVQAAFTDYHKNEPFPFTIVDVNIQYIYIYIYIYKHIIIKTNLYFIKNLLPIDLLRKIASEFPRHSISDPIQPNWLKSEYNKQNRKLACWSEVCMGYVILFFSIFFQFLFFLFLNISHLLHTLYDIKSI